MTKQRHSLLIKCLVGSIALHGTFAYILFKYPLAFTGGTPLFLNSKPLAKEVEMEDPSLPIEIALEEFFTKITVKNILDAQLPDHPPSTPQEESISHMNFLALAPKLLQDPNPDLASLDSNLTLAPSEKEELPLDTCLSPFTFSYSVTLPNPDLDPFANYVLQENAPLTQDEFLTELSHSSGPFKEPLPLKQETITTSSPSFLQERESVLKEQTPLVFTQQEPPSALENSASSFSYSPNLETVLAGKTLADVEDYLPIQSLFSLEWNDYFQVTPTFFPDETGYIFSLTITPKENLETKRIPQNVYFIIDTSASVEKHKATLFKRSVLKALATLQPHDRFNIFLLNNEISRLSNDTLPFSFSTLRLAEEFLEKKEERPFFSSFNLFERLEELLDGLDHNEELHTVVLLTNGKTSSTPAAERTAINTLLKKHGKKISLFAATAGKNNDLVTLDMITSLFKGKFIYSDTNTSLPRKLSSFMKNLQAPLIKDLTLALTCKDPKAKISLIPVSSNLPNLYQKEPLIIMGHINRLSALQLSLEGKNEEGWVLLNKEIDFQNAEESPGSLKKEWTLRQTSNLYQDFLEKPTDAQLKEAKEILKTAHGRTLGE